MLLICNIKQFHLDNCHDIGCIVRNPEKYKRLPVQPGFFYFTLSNPIKIAKLTRPLALQMPQGRNQLWKTCLFLFGSFCNFILFRDLNSYLDLMEVNSTRYSTLKKYLRNKNVSLRHLCNIRISRTRNFYSVKHSRKKGKKEVNPMISVQWNFILFKSTP